MQKSPRTSLVRIQERLSPEAWEQRIADARRREEIIQQVEAARATGERAARLRLAPAVSRSAFKKWCDRYRRMGFDGLIDHKLAPEASKVSSAVRAGIVAMREADPDVAVERIQAVIARRHAVTLSTSWIRKILVGAGLNRPRGGRRWEPEREELQFAGSIFLQLADEELGCSGSMSQAIADIASVAPAPAQEIEPEPEGRDDRGRFTATYNQGQAKGDADLGPAFRSVAEKRQEVDLRQRRLVKEEEATIQRKVQAMIALPLLTDSGKVLQLDDYRAYGVAEFAGVQYSAGVLDRFVRDLKYLGASSPLVAWHAGFWSGYETKARGGEEPPAALFCYVDGVGKPLWTQHFTKAGRVSGTGRVMPCLDQVLVHSGWGTPIFWQSYSGHASLVTQTLPLLDRLEATVGEDWWVDRLVVLDGEGDALSLFRACDARQPKRYFVTMLDDGRVKSPDDVEELGEWHPFRKHEEAAGGFIWLKDAKDREAPPYRLRVVLIRRVGGTAFSALGTNAPADRFEPVTVAGGYFQRWPLQELRFRTINQATHFKRLTGYGKIRVQNFTVLSELDDRQAQRDRLVKRIGKLRGKLKTDQGALTRAKLRLNASKARRARQDGLVCAELETPRLDRQILQDRIETTQQERERYAESEADIQTCSKAVEATRGKLDRALASLPRVEERIAALEDRKEIYQADTEMDQLMTVFKLCFVLLGEHALRRYFDGLRISLHGFMRQILALPGTRTIERGFEHIRIMASPNRKMMAAVSAACERVNALELRRNGRLLRLSVVPPGHALSKRARAQG